MLNRHSPVSVHAVTMGYSVPNPKTAHDQSKRCAAPQSLAILRSTAWPRQHYTSDTESNCLRTGDVGQRSKNADCKSSVPNCSLTCIGLLGGLASLAKM